MGPTARRSTARSPAAGAQPAPGTSTAAVPVTRLPLFPQALASLVTALREPPCVVFVDGAAGLGKSTLVAAALEAAGRQATWLVCRPAGPPLPWPRSTPAVLVVEDVQWLGEADRARLRMVVAEATGPVCVLVTYRADELPHPGLPLGAECRTPRVTRVVGVTLRALDREGIRHVLLSHGAPADQATADAVHRRTGGIPTLLAAQLAAPGGVVAPIGLPPAAAQWLARRVADLSPAGRRLLSAAAVLDRPATEAQLAAVAAVPVGRVMAPLCTMLAAGLIREVTPGRYAVTAGLLQRRLYEQIPAPRRQRLHALAVAALGTEEPADVLALVAHCRAAGDTAASVRHAEAAADAAMAVGSTEAAIGLLQEALAETAIAAATRDRLAVRLARIATVGLRREDTISVLRHLLRDSRLPAGVRGEIRLGLGLLLMNQAGEGEAGRVEIRRATGELRRRPALAARAMAALAMPQWGTCSADEHLWWLARAEHAAQRGRDPALTTGVFANRLSLLMNLGDPSVWPQIEGLREHEGTISQQQQVGRAYANLTDAAVWQGHYARAADFSREARRLAAQTGAEYVVGLVRSAELRMEWAVGRWSGLGERADGLRTELDGMPLLVADGRLTQAQLALARGEWSEAMALVDVAQLRDVGNGCGPELSAASAVRVRAWTGTGDLARAVGEGRRALDRERVKGVWGWSGELVRAAVDALVATGHVAEARAAVADLAAGVAGRDTPLAAAVLLSCRAALAEAGGDPDGAATLHERAYLAFESLPRPYDAAAALEALARCRGTGPGDADVLLAQASERYAALGASYDAGRCEHRLRANGAASPRRRGRRGYGRELSPREQDVARLMGLGRTNREIAEVLFLSVRTVEQHAARVLRKLQVANRADVATRLP